MIAGRPWRDYFHDALIVPGDMWFDRRFVAGLLDSERNGRSSGERLFGLLMFELWRREYRIDLALPRPDNRSFPEAHMKDRKPRRSTDAPRTENTLRFAQIIADRIKADRTQLAAQWQNPEGTRTRHFIVDDLLPGEIAERIWNAFPQSESIWHQRESFRERKKTFAKLGAVDPLISEITDAFHENNVLEAVRNLTQMEGLEADPELYAGGISMMGKGDFLNPHIDNSHDGPRERYRRLNLLYYISRDWQLDYGGNLELWDDAVRRPKVIQSKFNRLVVMETNRWSWHSVSPVMVEKNRCCISNYYFSRNSPEERHYYHVTSFTGRPHQTLARLWGRADNFMRQSVAVISGKSRGRSLTRYK